MDGILFILVSPIVVSRSNLKISQHVDFILLNYRRIIMSRVIKNKSLSRSCNLASFFFKKRQARVFHTSFGVVAF